MAPPLELMTGIDYDVTELTRFMELHPLTPGTLCSLINHMIYDLDTIPDHQCESLLERLHAALLTYPETFNDSQAQRIIEALMNFAHDESESVRVRAVTVCMVALKARPELRKWFFQTNGHLMIASRLSDGNLCTRWTALDTALAIIDVAKPNELAAFHSHGGSAALIRGLSDSNLNFQAKMRQILLEAGTIGRRDIVECFLVDKASLKSFVNSIKDEDLKSETLTEKLHVIKTLVSVNKDKVLEASDILRRCLWDISGMCWKDTAFRASLILLAMLK